VTGSLTYEYNTVTLPINVLIEGFGNATETVGK